MTNSIPNQKSKGKITKQKQNKHGPMQKSEVGLGCMEK